MLAADEGLANKCPRKGRASLLRFGAAMKQMMLAVFAVAAALLSMPIAAQEPAHIDSPKATILVSQPIVAGSTTLKPGEYRFRCRHLDGKSFVVITAVESGKEVVRVPCAAHSLEAKVVDPELRTVVQPNGSRTMKSVRFKGESIEHRVVE
jgi:hypothetical protein